MKIWNPDWNRYFFFLFIMIQAMHTNDMRSFDWVIKKLQASSEVVSHPVISKCQILNKNALMGGK